MAWNRPNGSEVKPRAATTRASSLRRGVIAGAVVAVGAAIAAWWLFISDPNDHDVIRPTKPTSRQIKESKPQASEASTNHLEVVKPIDPNARPTRVGEFVNGYTKLPNGRLYKVTGTVTSKTARVSLISKTFDEPIDQSLATLITLQPGADMLGDSSEYYEGFNESFKELMKKPIVIDPSDSEEVKLLKEGVIAARKELKECLDRGEDLTKVMRETRDQYRELSLYRIEIERQIETMLGERDDFTPQDIDDLKGAANKMLEERGVNPLTLSAALTYKLQEYKERKKIENEED